MMAFVHALLCLALDVDHCARWRLMPHGLFCSEVTLRPACENRRGWHLHAQGIPVCTVECGEDGPTS